MLLNIDQIRQLNKHDIDMSYMIIEKSLEKFFYDLIRNYGVVNQKYILIDSSYLPYQYLSIEVIDKVINLLEVELGYNIIIQKIDNRTEGFNIGDLIQIYLFDPLDYEKHDVDVITNSYISKTIYSTFLGFNNICGNNNKRVYLECREFKYLPDKLT